ncbi:MAG: hypothetical protein AAF600_08250 [Bacteroidota bacterium]
MQFYIFVEVRSLLFSVFITTFIATHAQVKVEATPTGKHAKAINISKETREAAKKRRQQARESKKKLKNYKKAKRIYREKYDSIVTQRKSELQIDSLKGIGPNPLENNVTLDSIQAIDTIRWISKEDSIAISKEILNNTAIPSEYKELIVKPPVIYMDSLKMQTQSLDKAVLLKVENTLETTIKESISDELNASPEDPLSNFTSPDDGVNIPELKKPSKPNPNLISPNQAKELFKKIDLKQFKDAQTNLQKLKKKYSKLPDSRYPEEGTRRNELSRLPFKKRLYFGGNVSLQSTDPFILNTNLQVGYWINKKWMAGIGFVLREQFSEEDTTSTIRGDGYGYSVFTRYDIKKGFFGWAESEFQLDKSFFGSQEQPMKSASWQYAYLLGIGREFKIGKVQMMSQILYDFNHQNNDFNSRPLVFRIGWQLSKQTE